MRCRLRQMQAAHRSSDATFLGDGGQQTQMANLQAGFHPMNILHRSDENKQ